MKTIKLGLIPSPDFPADLASHVIDELSDFLSATVNGTVHWKTQIIIDPLVGTAEHIKQVMDKSIQLKNKNEWDYVICLTDLPYFTDKYVIVADVNIKHKVALVSIPSFGSFPMKHRIKTMIASILKDLSVSSTHEHALQQSIKSYSFMVSRQTYNNHGESTEEQHNDKHHDTANDTTHEKDQRTQEDMEDKSDIRYLIKSKWIGHIRLLSGMTFANRPWSAFISFKKIIMLAFGTGIYITLFPTPWELSTIYSIPRFILLMFIAMFSMVIWLIFAHQLWEKPTQQGDVRLRKLYNYTTVTTLLIISVFNYVVLYLLFLVAIGIFVPIESFETVTNIKDKASLIYYFQLTWLITSLGTLAGSIGATSEDESKIRQITYSYRQINRYYDLQNDEEETSK